METNAELVVLIKLVVATVVFLETRAGSETGSVDSRTTDSVLTGEGDMKSLKDGVSDCAEEKTCVEDDCEAERGVLVTIREVDDTSKLLNEVVVD